MQYYSLLHTTHYISMIKNKNVPPRPTHTVLEMRTVMLGISLEKEL